MLDKKKVVLDFKSKLKVLYTECAEITQIIKTHEKEIIEDASERTEIRKETEGLRAESERLRQIITGLKNEKIALEDEIHKARSMSAAAMRENEAQAYRNFEQSKAILSDAKRKEADLLSREQAFHEKQKEWETRNAKIAELVGKR